MIILFLIFFQKIYWMVKKNNIIKGIATVIKICMIQVKLIIFIYLKNKKKIFFLGFYKNSIMTSLITIKNQLDILLNIEETNLEQSTVNKVKIEICDLLNFLNDLRQDFLISNFISWYSIK